jgi:hypothetical protein
MHRRRVGQALTQDAHRGHVATSVNVAASMLRQRTVASGSGGAGRAPPVTYTDWEDAEDAGLSWSALRREPRLWAVVAVVVLVAAYYVWALALRGGG